MSLNSGKGEVDYRERMESPFYYRKQISSLIDIGQRRNEVYLGINKRWKTKIETRKNSKGFLTLVKTNMLYFGFRKDQVINSPTSHPNEPLQKLFCFSFF